MKLIPVQSSNIRAVGYDPATREMQVQFLGGGIYSHSEITPQKHAEFVAAKSKGKHYNDVFRGKNGYKKITPA